MTDTIELYFNRLPNDIKRLLALYISLGTYLRLHSQLLGKIVGSRTGEVLRYRLEKKYKCRATNNSCSISIQQYFQYIIDWYDRFPHTDHLYITANKEFEDLHPDIITELEKKLHKYSFVFQKAQWYEVKNTVYDVKATNEYEAVYKLWNSQHFRHSLFNNRKISKNIINAHYMTPLTYCVNNVTDMINYKLLRIQYQ
jgi:hypothetical protein